MIKTYTEYKSTDINWVGNIPTHWNVLPCRAIVKNMTQKNDGGEIQQYLSLMANIGIVRYEDKGDVGNKKPDDLEKCKIVKHGNLVINSMNYAIGSYGMSPYDGVCSPVYIVLEPYEIIIERRFALRLFETKPLQKHLATLGNGILEHRAAIKWDDIKSQHVPLPPLIEQREIIKFLDAVTARIDALVKEKQAFIKLLKEKRQSIITHFVTKGLDPNVSLKDSGVEWIGEVPEHWYITPLKNLTKKIGSGKTPSGGSEVYLDKGVAFLRSQNIYDDGLKLDDVVYISEEIDKEMSNSRVFPGDILLNITGGSIGRTCLYPDNMLRANVNQHVCIIRMKNKDYIKYFSYVMQSKVIKSQVDYLQTGAGREGLNFSQISLFKVAVPPFDEIIDIVDKIENSLKYIDIIISETKKSIHLLKERRSALITAAVTGKIDVTEQANNKEEGI